MSFMDGVPVKICEKYKPPPKVTIPQAVLNRLKAPVNYLDGEQFKYDFTLEKCVVSKLDEWKRVREMEREKRRERMRQYELEKARRLEERQKELLTAVSYPNAEELSSGEEEEEPRADRLKEVNGATNAVQLASSQMNFNTILMPTIMPSAGLASKPSSVNSAFNYSDFENIESSPFDNIELKTINDLDILAQVLNVTNMHSNTDTSAEASQTPDPKPTNANPTPQPAPVPTLAARQQQQPQPPTPQHYTDYYNYNSLPVSNHNYLYSNNYAYQPPQLQYSYNHNQYASYCPPAAAADAMAIRNELQGNAAITEPPKCKSKSVPDILKEINSELLHSEARRARNLSQNLDDTKEYPPNDDESPPPQPNSYTKLSPSSQNIAKNISQMGFPLELVSKIAEKLGNDDKKIVEHLIPLSELLDLGFDETEISDALLKFNNNKEKALDFLIS